ncbi:MAG: LysR family transcriptional regulator [Treponema sp.]|jgi:DNA-binding transcriptional LysR family regulator|nr:LysR family transcriptional regulator [Treponema sp.]
MNTEFFLEFTVLADFESYGEAADQLLMSESALSRHIRALEDELGVRLFDRTSRKVRINEYGKIFLPYARQFITMQHQYSRDLQRARHGKETVFIYSFYYIDDFLFKFHVFDDSISIISINEGSIFSKWQDLLRLGSCELAFAINPDDNDNEFTLIPFETDRYVIVLPASHPLAARKSLLLSELSEESFISFTDIRSDRQLKELCRKSGFEPKIVFNTGPGSAIASFVSDGMGISILQKKSLSKMNAHGVAIVDLEPRESINVCICYPKAAKLAEGAKRLLQFATKNWPELKVKQSRNRR